MSKHGLSVLAAVVLTLALAAVALAQTTEKKVVQNPDGTYTIIEYPAKRSTSHPYSSEHYRRHGRGDDSSRRRRHEDQIKSGERSRGRNRADALCN